MAINDFKLALDPYLWDQYADIAQCVWEYVHAYPRFQKNDMGVLELRRRCREPKLCIAIQNAWEIVEAKGYIEPFDWEFVPWFIDHCTDNNLNLIDGWMEKVTALEVK